MHALAVINVRKRDVEHDRNSGKCFQLGVFGEHPARDRVFQAKHIADRASSSIRRRAFGWRVPALVRIENDLHAGRMFSYFAAPTGHIIFQAALEFDAVVAGGGKASREWFDVGERAMARPGADANLLLHGAAQQIDERHVVLFRKGVPDGTLETVIFAAVGDRQFLTWQVCQRRADESPRDAFDNSPIVVAVEFAEPNDSVAEMQFQNAFWQCIELHGPRGLPGDRQFVEWLVDARTINRPGPCRHDNFGGNNSFDPRHRPPTIICSRQFVKSS